MSRLVGLLLAVLVLPSSAVSCSEKNATTGSAKQGAEELAGHECAACGMTVRDQPAPRGQLVHNDATRLFFCSLSDMITYLEAPSPHGKVVQIYAESMDSDPDPIASKTELRPWINATTSTYVVGFEKRVMGTPILSYSTAAEAEDLASRISAQVKSWEDLQAWTTTRGK
ncbi:MAG: hypothetical protein GY811_03545 [Myxococcales bacterium]|nr:hypothetical protein [Myxococcales bacterium]